LTIALYIFGRFNVLFLLRCESTSFVIAHMIRDSFFQSCLLFVYNRDLNNWDKHTSKDTVRACQFIF